MISQLAKVNKKEDTFGMNDDDWDVYNTVRKDQGDSDSEEEQQKLTEYEASSLQKFVREHSHTTSDFWVNVNTMRKITQAFWEKLNFL